MRLKLIIADPDQSYLSALEQYFWNNHQERFYLGFFSKQEYLLDYLEKNHQDVDVLLVNTDFLTEEMKSMGIGKVFLFSEGKILKESSNLPTIKKYQPCDVLVGKIIEACGEGQDLKEFASPLGAEGAKEQECRLISVYSPVGGAGKTTVSIAAATLLAQKGKGVFYLNLEGISSGSLYFQHEGEYSVSNLLYMIKNKKSNLSLKLESMVMKDFATEIYYMAPLESSMELEELEEEDIEGLLAELQGCGKYDYIIMDLSSSFDTRNLQFMGLSHNILMLLTPSISSQLKGEELLKQIKRNPQLKEEILHKTHWIMNCSEDLEEEIHIGDEMVENHLPVNREAWVKRENQLVLNSNSEFSKALYKILNQHEL